YGTDRLNQFLSIVVIACLVLSFVFGQVFYYISLVCLAIELFRTFSKNTTKRYEENQKYLQMEAAVKNKFSGFKRTTSQSKDYHIYKCPGCGQKIRVPRGKGKIVITCRKCGTEFTKRS
ncbi:MAG: hypothetical protein LUE87_01095, partial [Lachnospiraceae bacterium]|nr:hypothetical protein [Lachnospiraceae bacterium]